MVPMRRYPMRPALAASSLLLLLLPAACSRPAGLHGDAGSAKAEQRPAPFRDGEESKSPKSATGSETPRAAESKPEAPVPFRDSQSLPAGTLLVVRLKNPILAEDPVAGETFGAVVDEPLVVEGNAMLPRGTSVSGRVESARSSRLKRNRGYVRLTLDSVEIGGRETPIQTSSLFVRANASQIQGSEADSSPHLIRLESGRRLTFRLAETAYLTPPASPQSH